VKTVSGRRLCRVLERHRWVLVRVGGSHHIYEKSGVDARLSVPVHGTRILTPGLLHHLLSQAGLSESDL
jgi:predicted RNA binding protein YcfA (HicA-like mRNA interferase family)